MKKVKTLRTMSIMLMLGASLTAVHTASADPLKVDNAFFEKQKQVVMDQTVTNSSNDASASKEVQKLENADYLYMSTDGQVYSSKRGYLGAAKKDDDIEASRVGDQPSPPISGKGPAVKDVNGGTTGAFERKQLAYSGFDSITSDITLPKVSGLGAGEQPWVYYGFDSDNASIEAGYAYQTGTFRWLPYIRSNGFYYADSAYQKYDGNRINSVQFYLAKTATSDTYYNAYMVVGGTQVTIAPTKFTDSDANSTSVKKVTSIAKKAFDGTNIEGRTMNQRYDNVQVSLFYQDQAYPWTQYPESSDFRNNKWYGTIDNPISYVHRDWDSTSIYKDTN